MIANQTELEKTLIRALITVFAGRSDPPEKADIEEKAKELALVLSYDGDLRSVVEGAMIAIDTRMGAGVSLVNLEANHDEDWVYKRDGVEWTYSEAYEDYLRSEDWQPTLVQSLSDIGMKILGQLQDPKSDGSWNRRGLVVISQ